MASRLRSPLVFAALLFVVLTVGYFCYRTYIFRYSDTSLASQFWETPTLDLPADEESVLYRGIAWIREDGFDEATRLLNTLPATHPDYPSAQFYAGYAYHQAEKYNGAMAALLNATEIGPSTIAARAQWMLLLTYLRTGRTDRSFSQLMRDILKDKSHPYRDQALALEQAIQSSWRSRWEQIEYGDKKTF